MQKKIRLKPHVVREVVNDVSALHRQIHWTLPVKILRIIHAAVRGNEELDEYVDALVVALSKEIDDYRSPSTIRSRVSRIVHEHVEIIREPKRSEGSR